MTSRQTIRCAWKFDDDALIHYSSEFLGNFESQSRWEIKSENWDVLCFFNRFLLVNLDQLLAKFAI